MGRTDDIEMLLSSMDISPTMYKNAVEKYQAIGTFINDVGIDSEIYPQGSFRTGTAVRPMLDGKERSYDIDLVCEIKGEKSQFSPSEIKAAIGNALKESKVYSNRLNEDDRCWTLDYADIGDIGFSLDVVPTVPENTDYINSLIFSGIPVEYATRAVGITEKKPSGLYVWRNSNPEGYARWFDNKNDRFSQNGRDARRLVYYDSHRDVYASVEDVPPLLDRSSLQQAIQVLKRSRDLFYTKAHAWSSRPISAIITTLAARISMHAPSNFGTGELLEFIVKDLQQYEGILSGKTAGHYANQETRDYLSKDEAKWKILNPVDPGDNYADCWVDATAALFFKWVAALDEDLLGNSKGMISDRTGLENAFGSATVNRILPAIPAASPIIVSQTKPWRK